MKKNAWARYWIRVHEIFVSGSEGNKWVEKYYYVLAVTGALMLSGFLTDEFFEKSMEFARGALRFVGVAILMLTYVGGLIYVLFLVISMFQALFKKN